MERKLENFMGIGTNNQLFLVSKSMDDYLQGKQGKGKTWEAGKHRGFELDTGKTPI